MVIVVGMITYFWASVFNQKIVYKQVEKEVILDNLKGKVNQLKGELVADIKQCESGGASEDKALITFDPHPTKKNVQIASLGNYQFKVSTVQYYYTKFYGKTITNKEAVLIALDDTQAGNLASEVIFRDGALDNWYNCTKAHNSRAKLDVINSLLK